MASVGLMTSTTGVGHVSLGKLWTGITLTQVRITRPYALKLQAYNRLSTEHLSHLSNRIDPFLEKKLLKLHFLEARSFYVLDEIFFS